LRWTEPRAGKNVLGNGNKGTIMKRI